MKKLPYLFSSIILLFISFNLQAQTYFTATQNENDANIVLDWRYEVDSCLLDPNGNPYGGIFISIVDEAQPFSNLFELSISDLSPYIGPNQPDFDYISEMSSIQGYYDYDFSADPALNAVADYTLELWMRSANPSSMIFNNIFPQKSIQLIDHNEIKFNDGNGTLGSVTFDSLRIDHWQHFAFSYDESADETKVYVNGIYKGMITGGFSLADFRSFGGTTGSSFAELRVWDRIRNDAEIENNILTISNTVPGLVIRLKHDNVGNGIMVDFASAGGIQDFTIDQNSFQILAYQATPQYNPLIGQFIHEAGPGKTIQYKLTLLDVVSFQQDAECGVLTATGSTLPYQDLDSILVSTNKLNQIDLGWRNNSSLTTEFRVFRDNDLLATIDTSISVGAYFEFQDIYQFNDNNSIENGNTYQYKIETFSQDVNTTFTNILGNGTTVPINFEATDLNSGNLDKIELSWSNGLQTLTDKIDIFRNDQFLKTVSPTTNNFTDFQAIYGEPNAYKLKLYQAELPLIEVKDDGSIPANGKVKGKVITKQGNYPVEGVTISIERLDNGQINTSLTDQKGEFEIEDIAYGLLDSFKIKATLSGHTFKAVSQLLEDSTHVVNLSRNEPISEGTIFLDETELQEDVTNVAINSFTLTPETSQDKVSLNWSASSSSSNVFTEISRDGEIIYLELGSSYLNGSFDDLGGTPGAIHKYTLRIFTLNNMKVKEITQVESAIFPPVAPVPSGQFSAIDDLLNGTVGLNWSHSSTNIDGFKIYRDSMLIQEVNPAVFQLEDISFEYNKDLLYEISAYRIINGIEFESDSRTIANPAIINMSGMPLPENVTATVDNNKLSVNVSWDEPSGVNASYPISGYRIYRDTQLIDVVYKDRILHYEDLDGFAYSNINFEFYISTFRLNEDGSIEESFKVASNSLNYPTLPAYDFTAVTATQSRWVQILEQDFTIALNKNIDGFRLYRDGQFIRSTAIYLYFQDTPTANGNYSYSVTTYKEIDNVIYESAPITKQVDVNFPSNPLPKPFNFKATEDLEGQVHLSWDYNLNIPGLQFLVTATDEQSFDVKDTLPIEARSHYDYTLNRGQPLFYTIRVVNADFTASSTYVYTIGKSQIRKKLNGMLTDSKSIGLPNTLVELRQQFDGMNPGEYYVLGHARTDSTGYYEISTQGFDYDGNGFPAPFNLYLKAISPNADFITDSVSLDLFNDDKVYRTDFYASNEMLIANEETALLTHLNVYTDSLMLENVITYNSFNDQFSQVEFKRGLNLIYESDNTATKFLIDSSAIPGIDYTYIGRSIHEKSDGKFYTEPLNASIGLPKLLPVINLSAVPDPIQNHILIRWNHKFRNADKYVVLRNDELFAEIPASERLEVVDDNGQPGSTYNYTVYAYLLRNGNEIISEPKVVSATFPRVAAPRNLTLSVPINSYVPILADSSLIDNDYKENHILLEWTYEDEDIDGFRIFRNAVEIAIVPDSIRSYEDFFGIPLSNNVFEVKAFNDLNEIQIESQSGSEEGSILPSLSPISHLDIISNDSLGLIEVHFQYLYKGADKFVIYRSEDQNFDQSDVIGTIEHDRSLTNSILIFQDKSGQQVVRDFPDEIETNYYYAVKAIAIRENTTYESSLSEWPAAVPYPKLAPPFNAQTDGGNIPRGIVVKWEYPEDIDVYGFEIIRLVNGLFTEFYYMPGNTRSFVDTLMVHPNEGDWQYRIAAYTENFVLLSDYDTVNVEKYVPIINDINIGADQPYTHDIPSIAVHGEWAIVGNPIGVNTNPESSAMVYRYIGDANDPNDDYLPGWQLWQMLETPTSPIDQSDNPHVARGFQVNINDSLMIISSEDDISPYPDTNSVEIYRLDPNSSTPNWVLDTMLYEPSSPTFLGYRVAIDGRTCVMSRWQHPMEVISDEDSDGNWEVKHVDHFLPNDTYGVAADISGDRIAVGAYLTDHFSNGNTGSVFVYQVVGDSVKLIQEINGTFANAQIGRKITMDEEFLVTGSGRFGSATVNQLSIYTWNETTKQYNSNPQLISIPVPDGGNFGERIELKNGILAVTTPAFYEHPVAQSNASRLYLYKNNNGMFEPIQETREAFFDSGYLEDKYPGNFGTGLGLSEHHIIVGSPESTLFNGDPAPSIYFFDLYPHEISNVNATDGTENFTKVTWHSEFDPLAVKEIRIYRDQNHIATVDVGDTIFIDQVSSLLPEAPAAITGELYTYSVREVYDTPYDVETFDAEQSDKGYAPINGKYSGLVYVNGTTTPVPNVFVEISAVLNDNIYKYDTLTNINGEFTFENLPFSMEGTAYNFKLEYLDHPFELINPSVIPALNPASPEKLDLIFHDKEAFAITGEIQQLNAICLQDEVRVVLQKTINGNTFNSDSTNAVDGRYNFVINPYEANLQELKVIVKDLQIDYSDPNNPDSSLYDFRALSVTSITDFSNLASITTMDFQEELTYPIQVYLRDACTSAISSSIFTINIKSKDGCFNEEYLTTTSGDLFVNLPLHDYEIKVVGTNSSNQNDLQAVDYLSTKPISLELKTIHESYKPNLAPIFEPITLVFHKAATIASINAAFTDFLACDPNSAAVIEQGNSYSMALNISENHGSNCSVNEGYVVISNTASEDPAPVRVDWENGGFADYTFIAGPPNLIAPHLQNLQLSYFSNAGDLLASLEKTIFVQGEASLPGAAVIVEPGQDSEGNLKIPLYVLRDPPGDNSFARLEAGAEINTALKFERSDQSDWGIYSDGKFGVGANALFGAFWNVDNRWGSTDANSTTNITTFKTTTAYSTSNLEDKVGRSANVIVGSGMASQYGLTQKLEWVDCDSIVKSTQVRFGLGNLETTWAYTVEFIEQRIDQYTQDSLLIDLGLKNYYHSNGEPLAQNEARERISALIGGWRDILQYHDVSAVPFYALCRNSETTLFQSPSTTSNIQLWKQNFCQEIGTLPGENFTLDESINWDNTLLTKYNNTVAALEGLKKVPPFQNPPSNLTFLFSRYSSPTYANDYQQSLGSDVKSAETISYSNGVNISKTIEQQQTTEVDYEYTSYNTYSNAFGLQTFVEGTITVPIVGTQIKIVETDISLGAKTTGMGSESTFRDTSSVNTATVYYEIDETDPGDNGTVNVFMGSNFSHSPYFMWVGGETSCPPEQAMTVGNDVDPVSIDNPFIAVINPLSQAVIASGEENGNPYAPPQYNVDPANQATFHIRIVNNTSTTLNRNLEVFLDPASNPFGATVSLAGLALGSQVFTQLQPGVATDLVLLVSRPAGTPFYDFENLKIGIRAECDSDGGDRNPLIVSKYIYVSAFFQSPCSPISITSPEDGFVVQRENINDLDDREEIIFALRDYQSSNLNLEEVQLQYQRIGTGIGWQDVPGGIISRADLAASDAMLAGNQQPVYFFSWDLTGSYNLYPDGDYKIRAIAVCNAVGQKISNEVTGELSRTQIIVGATEPADGIWSTGDEISISYSEMIDCGVINTPAYQDSNLIMIDTTTGLEVDFETVCLNNKIVFLPEGGMVQYDGHVLQVRAKNITNLAQNFAADAVWNFRVVAQSVDFAEEKLEVYLYQGTQLEMNTPLINTVNTFVNGLSTDQNSSATWLQIMPNNPFNVAPLGQELTFLFNGTGNVGTYTDTINVLGLIGRQPSIVVTMHILKPAPTITVTGSYQDSMYFVGNWRFDIDAELSQDTMDQILVFIGNELRGSGRIQKSGPFYHTTFTVKGDPMDNGQSLDFQIWNSDDESLYEGLHIPFDASFDAGAVLGSIYQPEVLIVEGDPILRKRIYVDSAQVTNVKNGLLWSTAFTDLDDALAIAQPFDTVWMAKGHYYPTNGSDRSLSYNGKDNVVIFGGFVSGQFSPLERTGMDETILSGDIGSVGQMLDNSYHVLTNTASGMILDGITIADANANGTGNNDTGGGIDNSGQITLRNVIFKNCNALNRGSCIRNSGNEATMILQDVQLSSPSILEWILNSDGALMTIINSGELKN